MHALASVISVSKGAEGTLYVGASFDPGKLEMYTKEASGRTNLAKVFVSFVEAVKLNVMKW